jgi:8-oxo-dGTP pyrophosphatase MutT (NUDIX family)
MSGAKESFGIICIRQNAETKNYEFLMVKKNTTYYFAEFVNGKYQSNNANYLLYLFNNMTFHEKKDILSMNFSQMWYRLNNENENTITRYVSSQYYKRKEKFEKTFAVDGGKKLAELIKKSNSEEDTPWEFPRGRKKDRERDLNAALREFSEETTISDARINILYHIKPYKESYQDCGVKYKNIYYFAEMKKDIDKKAELHDSKISAKINDSFDEIVSIKWLSKIDISHMKLTQKTEKKLTKLLEKVKRKYKNYIHSIS